MSEKVEREEKSGGSVLTGSVHACEYLQAAHQIHTFEHIKVKERENYEREKVGVTLSRSFIQQI